MMVFRGLRSRLTSGNSPPRSFKISRASVAVTSSLLQSLREAKATPLDTCPHGFSCLWARHNSWWELSSKPGTGSVEKRMSVGLPHGLDHRAEKSSYRLAARTDPAETQEG
jgi:hypothetical protein